jgi:hypothetical protein
MLEPNPKKLFGDKKPPLHLLPLTGMIHQSLAHLDGDNQSRIENWNDKPVEKLTYIGAALRHLELYKYGESYSRDTRVHNLGAVMACCAIMLDAELNGNLIDNTKHSKATCDLLHQMEETVKALNEMQKERDAAKVKADTFTLLHKEATARMGMTPGPLVYIDAGGDAPMYEPGETLRTCRDCKGWSACSRMGECIGAQARED